MAEVTESAAARRSLRNDVIGGVVVSKGPLLVREELPEVDPVADKRVPASA